MSEKINDYLAGFFVSVAIAYDWLAVRITGTTSDVWGFLNESSGAIASIGVIVTIAIKIYVTLRPRERRRDKW